VIILLKLITISLIIYFDLYCSFLQAYQKEGIDIWGLTAQNEPGDGYYIYFHINSCEYSPEEERNFVANNLGPTLQKHNFEKVLIIGCDDQRTVLPERAEVVSAAPKLTGT
jgi:glucosylceramidase